MTLEKYYQDIEESLPVQYAPEYADLVVANGNHELPVHRWFRLKEAFSSSLFARIVDDSGLGQRSSLRVLDPYSGSGTTQVAVVEHVLTGRLRDATVYGIERNPFLHLLASTKLQALKEPPEDFAAYAWEVSKVALASRSTPVLPALSTFHRPEFFEHQDLEQLLRLRDAIDSQNSQLRSAVSMNLALICIGAAVGSISNLRRDGRALRYVSKPQRPSALEAFIEKATQVDADLKSFLGMSRGVGRMSGRVILGDGRILEGIDARFVPFDLVIFSPPYPNNIDYTEVYKLENWILGFIQNQAEFRSQRLGTVYSHPSVLRDDPLPCEMLESRENETLSQVAFDIVANVPKDRYYESRLRMLRGYLRDMLLTLKSAAKMLSPSGKVVYVVGNSVHGRPPGDFVIAADLLLAKLAGMAGLSVERLAVARTLRRRESKSRFIRESVVFLQPG